MVGKTELSLQIPTPVVRFAAQHRQTAAHTHLGPARDGTPPTMGALLKFHSFTHHVAPMRMGTHSQCSGPSVSLPQELGNPGNSSAMRPLGGAPPFGVGAVPQCACSNRRCPTPLQGTRFQSSLQTPSEPLFLCTFKAPHCCPTWLRQLTGDHPAECGSLSLTSGRESGTPGSKGQSLPLVSHM